MHYTIIIRTIKFIAYNYDKLFVITLVGILELLS